MLFFTSHLSFFLFFSFFFFFSSSFSFFFFFLFFFFFFLVEIWERKVRRDFGNSLEERKVSVPLGGNWDEEES